MEKPAEIIYIFFKDILLRKYRENLNYLETPTKSFAEMRKLQRLNSNKTIKFFSFFKFTSQEIRTLEMAFLINYFPKELFSENPTNKDKLMTFESNLIVQSILNEPYYQNLLHNLKRYLEIFKEWKELDKNETIQNIIISYHYRQQHLEKIKKDSNLDHETKLLSIKQINSQISHLEQSILMIDKNFDLENLKNNHQQLAEKLIKINLSVENQVKTQMSKAYLDYLISSANQGNWLPIHDEIKATQKRLVDLVPNKRKKSIENKFNSYSFEELHLQQWEEKLLEMIVFSLDLLINLDAPINDEENQQWKIKVLSLLEKPFVEGLSELLIKINQKIDRILLHIKNLIN